ncbi:unnamed protein product, partial [Polarella glacialis]
MQGLPLMGRSQFSSVVFDGELQSLGRLSEDPSEILAASGKFARSLMTVAARRQQQSSGCTASSPSKLEEALLKKLSGSRSQWADMGPESEEKTEVADDASRVADYIARKVVDDASKVHGACEDGAKDVYMEGTKQEFERWSWSTAATDYALDDCPSPDPWGEPVQYNRIRGGQHFDVKKEETGVPFADHGSKGPVLGASNPQMRPPGNFT